MSDAAPRLFHVKFFVPAASDDEQAEEVYAEFARFAGHAVPERSARIRRIEFVHDGERWVAEVGQPLKGVKLDRTGSSTGRSVSDQATVLAIFAGSPFMVVTTGRGVANVRSAWENPFMAGRPEEVEYFDG